MPSLTFRVKTGWGLSKEQQKNSRSIPWRGGGMSRGYLSCIRGRKQSLVIWKGPMAFRLPWPGRHRGSRVIHMGPESTGCGGPGRKSPANRKWEQKTWLHGQHWDGPTENPRTQSWKSPEGQRMAQPGVKEHWAGVRMPSAWSQVGERTTQQLLKQPLSFHCRSLGNGIHRCLCMFQNFLR